MARDEGRDFIEWLGKFPFKLGYWALGLFVLGFVALVASAILIGICVVSVENGVMAGAFGVAAMSLGVGLISIGAAYKSEVGIQVAKGEEVNMSGQGEERVSKPNWYRQLKTKLERQKKQAVSAAEAGNVDLPKKSKEDLILERLDKIESKLEKINIENRRSTSFVALLSLCATVMLSGIALIAVGDDYASYGRILSTAGIIVILIGSTAGFFNYKRVCGIIYLVGLIITGLGIALFLLTSWDEALWVFALPGMLIMIFVSIVSLYPMLKKRNNYE